MFKFFRRGPKRVTEAYGLFTRAIRKLEEARDACQSDLGIIVTKVNDLNKEREACLKASANADHAIDNIRKLIGE
jgi:hypothetical protein